MQNPDMLYFGHSWHVNCVGLEKISIGSRCKFLVCLYFSVMTDQAVYTHYRGLHARFEKMAAYPKFCHGLGQFQKNPRDLLDVPVDCGFVDRQDLLQVMAEGMELFVDEVVSFCRDHMRELQPAEFFDKLIYDPDVQIPELLVIADPALKGMPGWVAYDSLRRAVKDRFSSSPTTDD